MSEHVKHRAYDNSRREAQARATKADVIAGARQLFMERGYIGTTIEAIGTAANTPLATLYRLFGSKRGILSAVLDVSFVGDDEPVAFGNRPQVMALLLDEPDPRRILKSLARLRREMLDRVAPMEGVLRSAASVDLEAAELLAVTNKQRLTGQSRVAKVLSQRQALADGVSERDAADIIYTLTSLDLYLILIGERGWSADRYERWLANALRALLLSAVV